MMFVRGSTETNLRICDAPGKDRDYWFVNQGRESNGVNPRRGYINTNGYKAVMIIDLGYITMIQSVDHVSATPTMLCQCVVYWQKEGHAFISTTKSAR